MKVKLDKERELKFSQLSLEVFGDKVNRDAVNTSVIYATFYAGLVTACYAKNEDQDFTFGDVVDWVDKMHEEGQKEEIQKVCDAWGECYAWKNWLKEFNDKLRTEPETKTEVKKKLK